MAILTAILLSDWPSYTLPPPVTVFCLHSYARRHTLHIVDWLLAGQMYANIPGSPVGEIRTIASRGSPLVLMRVLSDGPLTSAPILHLQHFLLVAVNMEAQRPPCLTRPLQGCRGYQSRSLTCDGAEKRSYLPNALFCVLMQEIADEYIEEFSIDALSSFSP